MNRKRYTLTAACVLALALMGCGILKWNADEPAAQKSPEKIVETMILQEAARPLSLEYIGTVDSDKTVTLSFKKGGVLHSVNVKKGDAVKAGDLLAQQESTDYSLSAEAASAQSAVQESILKKTEDALAYSEKQVARIEALHQAQAVSESEAEQARLELEVRRQDVQAARQALIQTQAQIRLTQNALSDTRLISPVTGYVVEAPFDAGELVGDGVPVVIVRSEQELVRISVSQKDLPQITLGMKARVDIDGSLGDGVVTNIAQVPNAQTRSYVVEVQMASGDYPIGAIARVTLLGSEEKGVLIPVEALQSSGTSYVYIVRAGAVVKKEVSLHQTEGPWVFTTGVFAGDELIVEGMKRVQPGDRVKTSKGGN